MRVFKVLNPMTGAYIDAHTLEACYAQVAEIALSLLNSYTDNQPYSVCETDENGLEVWRNAHGEEIMSPALANQKMIDKLSVPLTSIEPTQVNELP
jgi:hypothetical protein